MKVEEVMIILKNLKERVKLTATELAALRIVMEYFEYGHRKK